MNVDDQFKALAREEPGQEVRKDRTVGTKSVFPVFGIMQAGDGVEIAEIQCENLHFVESLCLVGGVNVTGSANCRDHGSKSPAF